MMKHRSMIVTGLVGAERHRFPAAATPACAAFMDQVAAAAAAAGIAADGLAGAPRSAPTLPACDFAPAMEGGLLCAAPAFLWLLETVAEASPDTLFVVCYEAPWHAFDTLLAQAPDRFLPDPRAALDSWRMYYREALRLRATLGQRMVFVNARFTGGWDPRLLAYLQQHGVTLARATAPDAGTGDQDAAGLAFAHMLDAAAPEYLDVYEALEGCALLFGRAPEFRPALAAAPGDYADAMLRQWSKGPAEKHLRAQLAAMRQELEAAARRDATVQAELDTASQRVRELAAEVKDERARIERLRAELLAQAQEFATQRQALAQSIDAAAAAAAQAASEARVEQACMLETLHRTQEDLEESFAESEALHGIATRANDLLMQAWTLIATPPPREPA